MNEEENKRSYEWLAEIVKVSVLSWCRFIDTFLHGLFSKNGPNFYRQYFFWIFD